MMIRATLLSLLCLIPAPLLLVEASMDAAEVISTFLEEDSEVPGREQRNLILNRGSDQGEIGDRCGLLLNRDSDACDEGLECSSWSPIMTMGNRCMPRQDCLTSNLQIFQDTVDLESLQRQIFQAANVTATDFLQARRSTMGNDAAFVQSAPIQALQREVLASAGNFTELGTIVRECTSPQVLPTTTQRNSSVGLNATNDDHHRKLQTGETAGGPTIFLGAHLEAGAGLDASASVFWPLDNGQVNFTSAIHLRACGGIEIGAGVELSFIVLVSLSDKVADMDCLSVLIDGDAAPLLAVGLAAGFCVRDSNAIYFEFTVGGGAGGGVGVSACEVWTFL